MIKLSSLSTEAKTPAACVAEALESHKFPMTFLGQPAVVAALAAELRRGDNGVHLARALGSTATRELLQVDTEDAQDMAEGATQHFYLMVLDALRDTGLIDHTLDIQARTKRPERTAQKARLYLARDSHHPVQDVHAAYVVVEGVGRQTVLKVLQEYFGLPEALPNGILSRQVTDSRNSDPAYAALGIEKLIIPIHYDGEPWLCELVPHDIESYRMQQATREAYVASRQLEVASALGQTN